MLLVHPVHEVLRQLPVLIGSIVLGSATGNQAWPLAALGLTVGLGLAALVLHHATGSTTTTPQLRTGVLQRRSIIRAAQPHSLGPDRFPAAAPAAGAHRAAGRHRPGSPRREPLSRWMRSRSSQVPQLRATLLADSSAPEVATDRAGTELARWHPSWLRYAPLSFSGLLMIAAAVGVAYQSGIGALHVGRGSRTAGRRGRAPRPGVVVVVSVGVAGDRGASVLLAVIWSC